MVRDDKREARIPVDYLRQHPVGAMSPEDWIRAQRNAGRAQNRTDRDSVNLYQTWINDFDVELQRRRHGSEHIHLFREYQDALRTETRTHRRNIARDSAAARRQETEQRQREGALRHAAARSTENEHRRRPSFAHAHSEHAGSSRRPSVRRQSDAGGVRRQHSTARRRSEAHGRRGSHSHSHRHHDHYDHDEHRYGRRG